MSALARVWDAFVSLAVDFMDGVRIIMGFVPPPPPPAKKPDKPQDCTCAYPEGRARNVTLHAQSCPAYRRIMAHVMKDSGEFIAPHNVASPALHDPQTTDEPDGTDQFGPLALGTNGEPFIYPEEGETHGAERQPASETVDNSRRARYPRSSLIPGRSGQSLKG